MGVDAPPCDVHVLHYGGKAEWLDQCLASLAAAACRVHLVEGGFHGHIGAARAHAFSMGHAPYVAFVDDDDWLLTPGAIADCVAYLEAHQECVGVYTDLVHVHEDGRQDIERKAPWRPLRQLTHCPEVLHLHVMRRAPVMQYLDELRRWPTWEEYVLLGLLAAHGRWQHLPIIAYAKRVKPPASSSMRLASHGLWEAAVLRVAPILIAAHLRSREDTSFSG